MRILSISIFACLLLSACNGSKKSQQSKNNFEVNFIENSTLTDVIEKAKKSKKLIFVDFFTTWCVPCQLMDEQVYSDKNIGKFMNENFVSYRVNAEKGNGPNLSFLFQVNQYPTLLFLDHDGRVVERKEGAAFHTELKSLANQALAVNLTSSR